MTVWKLRFAKKIRKKNMSWKKTVFSFLAWLIYTIMTWFCLLCLGTAYCGQMGVDVRFGALIMICVVALAGLAAYLLRRLSGIREAFRSRRKLCVAAEAALAVSFLAAGLLLRIWKMGEAGETAAYFEIARVTEGQGIPQIAHGAVYFYVWMLHGIFRLLGNSFFMGVGCQIVLQYLGAVGVYYVLRRHAGPVSALTALGFFMCSPYMIRLGLNLSPGMLYFCFFIAVAALISRGSRGRLRQPFFVLVGIGVSLLVYMDIAGVLLMLFAFAAIFCRREESTPAHRRAGACLCFLLSFAAGFWGCVFVDSLVSQKSFEGVWNMWLQLYRPEKFALPLTVGILDLQTEGLILLGLMTLGIFSFWFVKKRERLTALMSAVCLTAAGSCFGIFTDEMPADLYLFFFFSVLAGVGLEQCLANGKVTGGATEELPVDEEELAEEETPMEDEQPAEEEELVEEEHLAEEEPPAEEEQPEPIQFLENPLPLPKKHVKKKTIDYDYPVADDDDYDSW